MFISSLGFASSRFGCSLFTYHSSVDHIHLILYVSNIFLTSSSFTLITRVIFRLSSEFTIFDLGPLSFFLGIATSRSDKEVFLSQTSFAKDILSRSDMATCNPYATPSDTKLKLSLDSDHVSDSTLYRSLVGALQYPTFTCHDLAYTV